MSDFTDFLNDYEEYERQFMEYMIRLDVAQRTDEFSTMDALFAELKIFIENKET